MSKGQPSPLTVRISDDLRAEIDAAAERAGMTRNAWVVCALRQVLGSPRGEDGDGASPTPHEVAAPKPSAGRRLSSVDGPPLPKHARVVEVNAFQTEGVDTNTGESIPGTVHGMRSRTVATLQRLGYEVIE